MLKQDIILNFQSINMVDGHAGSEVKFIAADRVVVNTSYCTQKVKKCFREEFVTTRNEERLPIPDYIHTEEELRNYVREHTCCWLM